MANEWWQTNLCFGTQTGPGLLERVRTENRSLQSAATPGVAHMLSIPNLPGLYSIESLTNAGSSSPEATLQTYFWALREKDESVRAARLEPALLQQMHDGNGAEGFRHNVEENTNIVAFGIIGQQQDGLDSVRCRCAIINARPGRARVRDAVSLPAAKEWRGVEAGEFLIFDFRFLIWEKTDLTESNEAGGGKRNLTGGNGVNREGA
jgi:hypothetical protein